MKKRQKTSLWAGAIGLTVLGGLIILISSAPATEPLADAQLTISETTWNFGDIPMSEGITTKSVTLTNASDSPLTVTGMQTSCMCTTAQIIHSNGSKSGLKGMVGHGGTSGLSEKIQAGEIATLLVRFDPNAHGPNGTGPITRTIELETNSQIQPNIRLTFSGNVIP